MAKHRTGIVGVLGQTNVGKSTFLNAVMGEKLLITSPKPQATRNRIRCIYTTDDEQIVFVDTPGLHRPHNQLSRHILREAFRSLRELDVILYMVAPWGSVSNYDRTVLESLDEEERPIILLVNKIDTARGNALEETLLDYDRTGKFRELIPISATEGKNIDEVLRTLRPYLPNGPVLFPADLKIDRPTEFLVAELIREKVFAVTFQEVPYKTAVLVKWMHERDDGLVEIRADIVVDSKSHKGIIIGTQGKLIKRIGSSVRPQIEALLGAHIYLELMVKIRRGWTKDENEIEQLSGS
ncbi:MAG TPA: GTPase Era [Candidatus Acetothermia bacterium]|nr:GTPase Era [Candidatus Acetothermia bacterium]HEX32409.1 GTPase Era [Candidatus Acetothermia bacterium]